MGKGRKPDRVYDAQGNRLQGQPTSALLKCARLHPGRPVWAFQRPGPGGWWELAEGDVAGHHRVVQEVVVR